MKPFIFFFFFVVFFSCNSGNETPSTIIQPKEMQSILWDVMRAQALANEMVLKDSSVNAAVQIKSLSKKIFQIHKTDSSNFNNSYNWYVQNPDALKLIFDSLYVQKERENTLRLKEKHGPHPQKKIILDE
ncbi:MAG: DUF4296 domain-containing protein [Ginsengibacter sp.]